MSTEAKFPVKVSSWSYQINKCTINIIDKNTKVTDIIEGRGTPEFGGIYHLNEEL